MAERHSKHPAETRRPARRRSSLAYARGVLSASLLILNTLFWCSFVFVFALFKLLLPVRSVRVAVDQVLNAIATRWVAGNSGWMRLTPQARWNVEGLDDLKYRGWYLVNCNHQSWVDILVLQHLLNHRIPMLKFFLKHQLIYVPVIGLAWWALDFPFMHRHPEATLRRHPEKRFDDIEATRRSCEKFSLVPTSVMNFAEGTRFTTRKHRSQHSPYRHLLKPKAGALALTLGALGDRFDSLLDVTIVYPGGAPTFWQFLCGEVEQVIVRARRVAIPPQFRARSYADDREYRKAFQQWLETLWREKDTQIDALEALPIPSVRH